MSVRHWFLLILPVVLRAQGTTPTTTITAAPASLTFQYTLGPTARLPAAQAVALKSNATNLVATLTISGDLPSNGDWLEPSIRRGMSVKLPGSVSFTATPTSLAAGTYNATVTLSAVDSGGASVTQTIAVRLVIAPAPSQLDFSPVGGLTFNYTTGGATPAHQHLLMYSEGAPLSVTISVSGAPWLDVSPTGSVQVGGLYLPVTVSIDSTELVKLIPKVYTANITVSSPAAINKSTTYPITLNVNAAVPSVTDTWPSGVVLNSGGTGATTVVLNGTSFFDTSTVSVTGFTSSTVITVTDSTVGTALTDSERISIPVYAAGVTFLRLMLGSPLPAGFVGVAYSQNLGAFADGGTGPYTWSATGLTGSGLSLSTAGLLSGTPVAAGNYSIVLTVTDANGATAYMPVKLTIYGTAAPPAGAVWITLANPLPSASVGTAYSQTVGVAGGTAPYAWTSDPSTPCPAGLSIGAAGAPTTVSGTPTSVGPTGNLTQKRLSDGALQVTVANTYLAKQGILRMTVHTPTPGGGDSNEAQLEVYGPEPRVLGVVNAANYAGGGVAPGELVSIFGTGLGPATLTVYDPNVSPLPTSLPTPAPAAGDTRVNFTDGVTTWPAALIYTSAMQVGAMVPFEVASAAGPVTMTVSYGPAGAALSSQSFPLTIVAAVPGIFTADGSGRGQAAALNYIAATNDYTVNSPTSPALLKDAPIVVLYLTGFGITNPASASNLPAGGGVDTNTPASVTIDGKAAAPVVTGVPQGSFPGLLQLNVTVPADATAGKTIPVTVNIGAAAAQTGVTIGLK
jgi:uncharacterized protein (TIGR03437 family)